MLRRWLIRSLFLLPLVCVLAVWVASYFRVILLDKYSGDRHRAIGALRGLVFMCQDGIDVFYDEPFRFTQTGGPLIHDAFRGWTTLGFYGGKVAGWRDSFFIIYPLWLPTLLLVGLNWFVWRKTRPKVAGRPFPVEPDNDSAKSK